MVPGSLLVSVGFFSIRFSWRVLTFGSGAYYEGDSFSRPEGGR